MLIDKFDCNCPNCHSKQTYYHVSSMNSNNSLPSLVNNVCSECGHLLRKENVPNWEEIEKGYCGIVGNDGMTN